MAPSQSIHRRLGQHGVWLDSGGGGAERLNATHDERADIDLEGARLAKAILRYAKLVRVCLVRADLRQADLVETGLLNIDARAADLRYADLAGARPEPSPCGLVSTHSQM